MTVGVNVGVRVRVHLSDQCQFGGKRLFRKTLERCQTSSI